MQIKVTAFQAVKQPSLCARFIQEHRNVLRDYGISNITTNNEDWINNPDVYCIVALSSDESVMLGGVRIQISTPGIPLPVELAVGKMDPTLIDLVKDLSQKGGVAEICALWNAKQVAGMGLSIVLVRSAIAVTTQLRMGSLLTICADYTLRTFQKVGFTVYDTLGASGEFPYPNASYTARVMRITDPALLAVAEEGDREKILALRKRPVQRSVEPGSGEQIIIDYNLVIPK